MAGPATAVDLQNRSLRVLTTQELNVGSIILGDAWSILTTRVPSLAARIAATPTNVSLHGLVVQIQSAMVLRVLNNPSGKLEEAGDDYRYRLDSAVSTGSLYASDAEIALLGANSGVSVAAFTIHPYGVTPDIPNLWNMAGTL